MMASARVAGSLLLFAVLFCGAAVPFWAMAEESSKGAKGILEVECNFSGVTLYLCPKEHFSMEETRVFFGLIRSQKAICSQGEMHLGMTPLKPVALDPRKYILRFPSDFEWEHKGLVEVEILPEQRKYFLLKLFSKRSDNRIDYGGGGGAGAGSR